MLYVESEFSETALPYQCSLTQPMKYKCLVEYNKIKLAHGLGDPSDGLCGSPLERINLNVSLQLNNVFF